MRGLLFVFSFILILLFSGCTQTNTKPPVLDEKHYCATVSDCVLSGSDPDGYATCVNKQWNEEWEKSPDSNKSRWECLLTGEERCGCVNNICKRTDNEKGCGEGQTPSTKEECEAQGGRWGQFTLNPSAPHRCSMPTIDAGRECTDGNECEAKRCLIDLTKEQRETHEQNASQPVKGRCVNWTITTGCMDTVEQGKYAGTLCVD